ncbi:MAG: magnesium transporter [Lacipirellulaceae bacterium]
MVQAHLDEPVLKHARRDFIRVDVDQSVADAMAQAREQKGDSQFLYFYVVNADGKLVGVLPTRSLLFADPHAPVLSIMQRGVVCVHELATLADACDLFLLHRYLAFPVVDSEKRIVGVVDVQVFTNELTGLAAQEEADDFFQLIGVRLAEVRRATSLGAFSRRFPWLLCNVAGGLAAAFLAGMFEGVLARAVLVSVFIPVVLALAESVSIQALTLTLQEHHARGSIGPGRVFRSLRRELPVGGMLGVGCASVVAAAAFAWRGDAPLALCLLTTIASTVTIATTFGVLVPLTLSVLRTDPRIAAGPITLAATDMVTLMVYLTLASALLK